MLITVDGERGYRKYFSNLDILLDGVKQANVLEADDEAGYIVRFLLDDDGHVVPDDTGRSVKRERLEGKVIFDGTRRYTPEDAKRDAEAKRNRRRARNLCVNNRCEVRSFSTEKSTC